MTEISDLSARFAFGGSRASREDRIRVERIERAKQLRLTLLEVSDEAEAMRLVTETSIGSIRKSQMREAWRTGTLDTLEIN